MSLPLRVAAIGITPPVFKASGGISAGMQLTRHIAALCDARFLMMSTEDSQDDEDGLRVIRRRAKNVLKPFAAILPGSAVTLMWRPALRRWLEAERPSIVHFHNPHPPGALAQAAGDCRALGIPYVISTHGFVEFNDFSNAMGAPAWQKPFFARLIREPVAAVARNAARILMLSPQEEPILRSMGVARERLDVVTNGVDHFFADRIPEADRRRLTARFAIPADRPMLFFVGNHTVNKGIDVLLRALPLMKVPAVAVIGGAIRSPRENAALLASVGFDKSDPRLLFTDFTTKEELRALYQRADLFVFPSYADTLPLAILEAMASGLPVVSTRVGGIPFEVTPETGVLIAAGDPAALARELDALCTDAARRKALGAAGRNRVLELFNWTASAQKAVQIYKDILAGQEPIHATP